MNRYLTILLALACLNCQRGLAQLNLTLYNMHTLPQRIHVNPAQVSDSRLFIGLPGFSSVHFLYGNTGFKIKELVSVDDSNRLNIHPLTFYNSLNKNNRIHLETDIDLIFFGFKLRKSNVSVCLSEKIKTQVSFPKDFFGLFLLGNAGENLGQDLNFNFGMDMMVYNDLSVCYSRSFLKDKLRLGAKAAYLNGLININTERSDLIFNTHQEDFHYTVRSDIKINTSSIFDTLKRGFEFGKFDYNVFKGRNKGLAFSLGCTYQLRPKIVLTASLIDLGSIKWKDNVRNYQTADPNKKIEYYGLNLNEIFGDNPNPDSSFKALLDSTKNALKLINTHESFKTSLPATLYLGGNFWLTKRHNIGLVLYGSYFRKKFNPAFTFSYNGKLTRVLGVSVSYSMIHNSFVNGGVGFTLNGGPFQYYAVADNILGIIKYKNANSVDFRMGINFTFFRKDKQAGLSGKK